MKVTLKEINMMDLVNLHGQLEKSTKALLSMVLFKAMERDIMQMVISMKVNFTIGKGKDKAL
jgi:hypothetical protein